MKLRKKNLIVEHVWDSLNSLILAIFIQKIVSKILLRKVTYNVIKRTYKILKNFNKHVIQTKNLNCIVLSLNHSFD